MGSLLKTLFAFTAEYKIVPKNGPASATVAQEKTITVYFWGFWNVTVQPDNSMGNGFSSLIVRRKLRHILISVFSLGIISPLTLIWECAKDNSIRDNSIELI
jgi:hypothetical protein